MKRIEDHIALIGSSASTEEIFSRLVQIMHGYGYDKVSYGCATDCPSLGLKKRHGHITNFNAGWLKHYAQNNLSEVDPVHVHALKARTPAFWSRCEENAPEASKQLMRDAADVGLRSGVIIPLCDVMGEVSMISLANDAPASEETYETLAAVSLLGAYFYEGYKSFIKKPEMIELTPREYEIMTWAAEGKTDIEIATLVNISVATVRYHWKHIFRKLNVYNRTYAVARAVQLRLIWPQHLA